MKDVHVRYGRVCLCNCCDVFDGGIRQILHLVSKIDQSALYLFIVPSLNHENKPWKIEMAQHQHGNLCKPPVFDAISPILFFM